MARRGILISSVILVALLVAIVLFIRYSPVVAQDTCLDGGGRWVEGRCETAP